MDYKCSVCSQKVEGDMIVLKDHTERHIVDLVKYDHPEWVQEDGICSKCVEYYRAEINGSVFGDAPCAVRIRGIKKIFKGISDLFQMKK